MMADGRGGIGKTRPDRLAAALRQIEALKMRAAGHSYEEIRARLGYRTRSGAYASVMAGLHKERVEPADETRVLELERLDRLLNAIWDKATGGDLEAVDRALKIMERRAKFMGLDAPTKIAPTDPSGETEYSGLSDAELEHELLKTLIAAGVRAAGGAEAQVGPAGAPGAEAPAG